MENVLLIGEDSDLLQARATTLSQSGANVACCSASELDARLWSEMFDLVVLCHTLKAGVQRPVVIAEVYRRWPRARILQILAGFGQPACESGADARLVSGDLGELGEPVQLAMEMLGKPPQSEWRPLSSRLRARQAG